MKILGLILFLFFGSLKLAYSQEEVFEDSSLWSSQVEKSSPLSLETVQAVIHEYINIKLSAAKAYRGKRLLTASTYLCFDHAYLMYFGNFRAYAAARGILIKEMRVLGYEPMSNAEHFAHVAVMFQTEDLQWWFSEQNGWYPFGQYEEGGFPNLASFSKYVKTYTSNTAEHVLPYYVNTGLVIKTDLLPEL